MLATAASVARADDDPQPIDPYVELAPPGLTEPQLRPPGLTPTAQACLADPSDPRCDPEEVIDDCTSDEPVDPDACAVGLPTYVVGGVVRGGFGHYFWVSGG